MKKTNFKQLEPWIEMLRVYNAGEIVNLCKTKKLKRVVGAVLSLAKWSIESERIKRAWECCGLCYAFEHNCRECILSDLTGVKINVRGKEMLSNVCNKICNGWASEYRQVKETPLEKRKIIIKEVLQVVTKAYEKLYNDYMGK